MKMNLLTLLTVMLRYATLQKYITRYLWGILLLYFTSSKDLLSNKECTAPLELLRISRPHVPRKSPADFRIWRKKQDERGEFILTCIFLSSILNFKYFLLFFTVIYSYFKAISFQFWIHLLGFFFSYIKDYKIESLVYVLCFVSLSRRLEYSWERLTGTRFYSLVINLP